MVKGLIGLIRFYQGFISPFKRSCCRFYPTCSEYATEAIREYGLFSGAFLALKRLLKCHPFHPGGYDPLNPDRHGSQMYGKGMKGIEKVAGVYPLNPLTPLNPLAPPNPFNHP